MFSLHNLGSSLSLIPTYIHTHARAHTLDHVLSILRKQAWLFANGGDAGDVVPDHQQIKFHLKKDNTDWVLVSTCDLQQGC